MANRYFIKAVLFDLDGVIIDSTKEIENFWEGWAKKENVIIDREAIVKYIHGRTPKETITQLFFASAPEVKKGIEISAGDFDKAMRPKLVEGVFDLLVQLSNAGVPLGLVTSSNKERIKPLLDHHKLYDLFNEMVTGDEVTHGKPDPEPYTKMASKLNVNAAECLVFEDSDSGIQSGLAGGMYVIAINNHHFRNSNILAHLKNFSVLSLKNGQIVCEAPPYPEIELSPAS